MKLEGKKILVTGGSGFLGDALIRRLLSQGCSVRTTVHEHPVLMEHRLLELIGANLMVFGDCERAVADCDIVFHCAAVTSGAAVIVSRPLAHVTPNVLMNTSLLEASYHSGIERFVFLSSGAAYPDTGERPVREDEMHSGPPPAVYFPVATMKRFTEQLCEMWATRARPPMSTVVVRPSNVYGPGDKFDPLTSHVTAALIRKVALRLSPLEVWGTGDDVRDLIHIEDFLDGLLLAAEVDAPHFAVTIASGQGTSVREVLQTLLEIDGRSGAELRFDPKRPSTIPVRLFDVTRAREVLGFETRRGLRDGLAETLAWFRKQGSSGKALLQAPLEFRRAS